jgi:2-polyprenyl-6-methoxyphenol hydroxylase-like FAD-dependent oxidoreductase
MGKIVIAGGGMVGMAVACMLADDGHEVTVLERDAAPPPPEPGEAFDGWARRGVGQFRLAHWLHPRGTRILREQVPAAYAALDEHGGFHFNFMRYVTGLTGSEPDPDVEQFDLLTGRRSTLEWAMAQAAEQHSGVTVRRGDAIDGFTVGDDVLDQVPHVTGLRLAGGDTIDADLVIDATGRRSPTPEWLDAIGATAPIEESEDSGFAYYGRYFRSDDGSHPAIMGPLLAPYGSFSVLVLPADNGTWAATLYGLSDDKALRKVRDVEVYERVMQACPLHAHWIDGEPMTDIISMAGVVDRHRQFVVDGMPCATGVLTVGDASSCTNPSLGRGITIGLMHAEVLRASVAEHFHDPATLALDFHHRTEEEIRPWHDATLVVDRRRVNEMRTYLAGGEPEPTPEERLVDTMAAAMGTDAIARRSMLDIFSCNALPSQVMARPGVAEHVASLVGTVDLTPAPGPDRQQLEELVG